MTSASWRMGRAAAICAGLLLASTQAFSGEFQKRDVEAKIEAMVADISRQPDIYARPEMAENLWSFIEIQEREILDNLSEKPINAIASLLGEKLATVQYWAAKSLGHIWPAARSAVPALERAEKHVEFSDNPRWKGGRIAVSASAVGTIRRALRRIRGLPEPEQRETP